MVKESRNVLLFLDNFSGHERGVDISGNLTNIRIEWQPVNCTSYLQPIDQGIGNAFKIRYRKYLNEHMAHNVMLGREAFQGVNELIHGLKRLGIPMITLDCSVLL